VGPLLTVAIVAAGAAGAARLVAHARRATRIDRARLLAARAPRSVPVPAPVARWVADALDRAGVTMAVADALRLGAAAALAATLVAGALAPQLAIPVLLGALVLEPCALVLARGRRDRALARSVPDVVDRIAAELRSGGTVALATAALARSDSPFAGDFARVEERRRLGASMPTALQAWAAERDVPGVRDAAGACSVALEAGGAAADALDGLAAALRDRAAVAAEAHALAAQARLSAVVIGAAPVAYLAWSALADPRSLSALVATSLGRMCLAAGAACEVAGALWMRWILRGAA
jgi:tight adherence protein B